MDLFDNTTITDQNFNNKCVSLSNDIKDGKTTFLQVIENLQSLLTHEDVDQREKGIVIIVTVLKELNDTSVSANEIEIICKFLLQRLKDHHQMLPAVIKGIKVIVERDTLPEKLAITILSTIFENIPCQQQQQADRYNIYCIFKKLLEIKEDELKSVGLDLVYGIISSIDSERDPRNLLFLFNWLPTFIQKIELRHLTEEMFEVLSCYFPVDFRPTFDETITRDILAKSLSRCLCAIPSFSEHTIPLALEKLDTELLTAKLDSLDLLIDGAECFTSENYIKYSADIWSLIQKDILTLKEDDLVQKGLIAFTSFIKKITSSESNIYIPILSNIIDNIKGNLIPDAKLFGISCRLVLNFASASEKSSEYICKTIIPLLTNLYTISSTTVERCAVLAILCDLTLVCLRNNTKDENLNQVPDLCLKAISDNDTDLKISGFNNFSKITGYIQNKTRDLFYDVLKVMLLAQLPQNLRSSMLDCFTIFSKVYPAEVENLIKTLRNDDLNTLELYLDAIGRIIETKALWDICLKQLIYYSVQNKATSAISLSILRDIIEKDIDGLERYLSEKEDVIAKLIDSFVGNYAEYDLENDISTLDNILTVMYRIVAKLDESEQGEIVNQNLDKLKSLDTQEMIVVWYGLLVGLRNNNCVDEHFIKDLIMIGFNSNNRYINGKTSELIGNIVNKLDNDILLDNILQHIHNQSKENIEKNNRVENTINLITFITKALVLRGHQKSTSWTNILLELSYKHDVSRSFDIIISDSYPSLSAVCHCKERILHKQKFFSTVMNYIEEKSNPGDTNFLMITAYLAQAIPKQLLCMNFTKLVKWLILCLNSCDDVNLKSSLISTINCVIEKKEGNVENYIGEILKCYTNVALKNKCMTVRILTLKGIQLLANYPTHKVVPLKENVLQSLALSLDDPKRLVRKEAVKTRLKWYFIDAPL